MANPTAPTWPRRRRRRVLAALSVLGLVALLVFLIFLRSLPGPPEFRPPPVPSPNGYDVLVRAAGMIEGPGPDRGGIADADLDALRVWVADNREALDLSDDALDLPSGVPLTYTQADLQASMADLGPLRTLGRLMLADARVDLADGRAGDASKRSIDAIRFARQATRNGLLLHALTGVAIEEGVGLEGLRLGLGQLDESQCREAARGLMKLDGSSPSLQEVLALEAGWGEASMPRSLRFSRALIPGVRGQLRALARPAHDSTRTALDRVAARRRLLAIELAIRAYRLRNDALPDRLEDLVPKDLPAVPSNPIDGDLPIYEVLDDGSYLLHFADPGEEDHGQDTSETR